MTMPRSGPPEGPWEANCRRPEEYSRDSGFHDYSTTRWMKVIKQFPKPVEFVAQFILKKIQGILANRTEISKTKRILRELRSTTR